MMSNRDFVAFSDDWHGLPTSAIHLVRPLAAHNRVFWFNTVGRLPSFNRADLKKVFGAMRGLVVGKPKRAAETMTDNVVVQTPVMVPWFKSGVRAFNRWSLRRRYERVAARHHIKDP